MSDYTLQRDMLVQIGSTCTWSTQHVLLEKEDDYASHRWVNVFTRASLQDWHVLRYLALTSLPFDVCDGLDQQATVFYKRTQVLRELWNVDFPKKEMIGSLIRRPTMPTGCFSAKYMFVGDAPGVHTGAFLNDHFDRVLVYGPSSHFLRKAALAAKMHTSSWYTNVLRLATPKNRPSTEEERKMFAAAFEREIAIIRPEYIICLGRHVHEQIDRYTIPSNIKNVAVYHPSYAMQQGRGNMTVQVYADHIQQAIARS